MNHSEVLELKKRLKKTDCSVNRIVGCYVTGIDKKIKTYIDENFLNLEELEQFKYLEILNKGLSGTLEKNLLNLSFTKEAEEQGGAAQSLLGLRETELKNEEALNAFYEKVIQNYDYVGNYLILMIFDAYDVPAKTTDNIRLGESEEVYRYVLCCICPVNLCKPGLSYHEEENRISPRTRDWVVDNPDIAFLFPAFNDRSSDIHKILYYAKDTDALHEELMEGMLGCGEEVPADKQKEMFQEIVSDVINDAGEYDTFEVVRAINQNLTEMLDGRDESEPVKLNKEDVKDLFRKSGVKEEHLDTVDRKYAEEIGEEEEFKAASIAENKRIELKTEDLKIQVKPESAELIEIRVIDGRKCLVIPMDTDVEVNGIVRRVIEELSEDHVNE